MLRLAFFPFASLPSEQIRETRYHHTDIYMLGHKHLLSICVTVRFSRAVASQRPREPWPDPLRFVVASCFHIIGLDSRARRSPVASCVLLLSRVRWRLVDQSNQLVVLKIIETELIHKRAQTIQKTVL